MTAVSTNPNNAAESALEGWLRGQLLVHRWSQAEAARQLRIDPKTIRALLTRPGRAYDPRTIKKLAAGFAIDEAVLIALAGENKYDVMMRTRLEQNPGYNAEWYARVDAARQQHPEWTQKMTASPGYRESRHRSAIAAGTANREAHGDGWSGDASTARPYFRALGKKRWAKVVKCHGLMAAKKRFLMVHRSGNPGARRPEVAKVLAERMTSDRVRLSSELGRLYKKVILKRTVTEGRNPPDSLRRQMHCRERPRRQGGGGPRKGGRPRHQSLPSDPYDLLKLIAKVVRAVDIDRLKLATVGAKLGGKYGWKIDRDVYGNPRCEKAGEVYRFGKALDRLDARSHLAEAWASQSALAQTTTG